MSVRCPHSIPSTVSTLLWLTNTVSLDPAMPRHWKTLELWTRARRRALPLVRATLLLGKVGGGARCLLPRNRTAACLPGVMNNWAIGDRIHFGSSTHAGGAEAARRVRVRLQRGGYGGGKVCVLLQQRQLMTQQ